MIRPMIRNLLSLTTPLALMACATVDQPAEAPLAQAQLTLGNGQPAGTVKVTGTGDHLKLEIAVTGVTPGPHGIHLHTVGHCDPSDFTTAGGHLNPHAKKHGSDNPEGSHLGDLPNVQVGANGEGTLNANLHGTRAEALTQLFDADGTAVVLHAGPDDYKTDPAGNSGGRIACGVLTRG